MANGKWKIKCEMRNAKCEMKLPDASSQMPDGFAHNLVRSVELGVRSEGALRADCNAHCVRQ